MLEKITVILSSLKRTPLTAKEISETTDVPLKTTYRHLKELEQRGCITKHQQLYQLTSKGRQLQEVLCA